MKRKAREKRKKFGSFILVASALVWSCSVSLLSSGVVPGG